MDITFKFHGYLYKPFFLTLHHVPSAYDYAPRTMEDSPYVDAA